MAKRSPIENVTELNLKTRRPADRKPPAIKPKAPAKRMPRTAWTPAKYPGLRNILSKPDPLSSGVPSACNTESSIEGEG